MRDQQIAQQIAHQIAQDKKIEAQDKKIEALYDKLMEMETSIKPLQYTGN